MKLVKQSKLHFREGNSDKVYEAEICEVGANQYIVNFRYGKRGANLTEGTKTVAPVDLSKAQDIFDKLIKEKTAKGYQDVSAGGEAKAVSEFLRTGDDATDRKNAILYHLELGVSNPPKQRQKRWNIKRAIWRAGELKLKEAASHLCNLFGKGLSKEVNLYNYCIVWSLGRTAAETETAEQAKVILWDFIANHGLETADMVRRIAKSSYLMLANAEEKSKLFAYLHDLLPDAVKKALNSPDLLDLLTDYLERGGHTIFNFIENLYLYSFGDPKVKKILLQWIALAQCKPNQWKQLRYVYKIALHQNDTQVWANLAAEFTLATPNFRGSWAVINYKKVKARPELAKADSRLAFSAQTRKKLVTEADKNLFALGKTGSLDYIKAATAFLLVYTESQKGHVYDKTTYERNAQTGRWESKILYTYSPYANEKHFIFNKILYANSQRYLLLNKEPFANCICAKGYAPRHVDLNQVYPQREESYPELWDKLPYAFVTLLINGKNEAVAEFALRGLKAQANYSEIITRFDKKTLLLLLASPINLTAKFALELIKLKFAPQEFEIDFLLQLLASTVAEVKQYVLDCLGVSQNRLIHSVETVFALLTHADYTVYEFGYKLFKSTEWESEKKKIFITKTISYFLSQNQDGRNNSKLPHIAEAFCDKFAAELSELNLLIINDLLNHQLAVVRTLGLSLLKLNQVLAERLPRELLTFLCFNGQEQLRAEGFLLLNQFSAAALRENIAFLLSLFISDNPISRQDAQKLLNKLLAAEQSAGEDICNQLIPFLLKKQLWEGLHGWITGYLKKELSNYLHIINRELIFRLLNVEFLPAQELAALLLARYVQPETMSLRSLVRLGSHEAIAVRQLCYQFFKNSVTRMRYEAADALRLLDSSWDDTREFAKGFFADNFGENEWTAELLISICDHTRPDVQQYGTNLLNRYFNPSNGSEYLLKLSQHPRHTIMQHVTNYLQNYASDNLPVLRQLEPYFITLLSQVNKARTGKTRIFAFLRQEGLKTAAAAQFVCEILDRISATVAIGDKATCIELIRDLKVAFPATNSLLVVSN